MEQVTQKQSNEGGLPVSLLTGVVWGIYFAPKLINGLIITNTQDEMERYSNPSQRHHPAKLLILELTNRHRTAEDGETHTRHSNRHPPQERGRHNAGLYF